MKRAWVLVVLVLVIACGNKQADKPAGGSAAPAPPAAAGGGGGPPPTTASVQSGEIALSGATAGTYHWTSDLNVTCTWIPDLKGGGIDVSLTDGAGKFMSMQLKNSNGMHEIDVTSGALKSASMLTSTSGFTMTGSDDRTHMTVTVDADVASKDAKLHVAGKLELACPP